MQHIERDIENANLGDYFDIYRPRTSDEFLFLLKKLEVSLFPESKTLTALSKTGFSSSYENNAFLTYWTRLNINRNYQLAVDLNFIKNLQDLDKFVNWDYHIGLRIHQSPILFLNDVNFYENLVYRLYNAYLEGNVIKKDYFRILCTKSDSKFYSTDKFKDVFMKIDQEKLSMEILDHLNGMKLQNLPKDIMNEIYKYYKPRIIDSDIFNFSSNIDIFTFPDVYNFYFGNITRNLRFL